MGSVLRALAMAMTFLGSSAAAGQEFHDEASACIHTSRDAQILYANLHVFGEEAVLGGPARTYLLEGMKPKTTYEVRISHTAAVPAQFHLELQRCLGPLLTGPTAAGEAPRAPSARKLLDTEKIILLSSDFPASEERPGNDGIKGGSRAVLFVSATQRGRRRASQGPSSGSTKPDDHRDDDFVRYNIVLQELWLGIIPLDSVPMGAALVAALAFALRIAFAVSRDDSSSPADEGCVVSRHDDDGKEQ